MSIRVFARIFPSLRSRSIWAGCRSPHRIPRQCNGFLNCRPAYKLKHQLVAARFLVLRAQIFDYRLDPRGTEHLNFSRLG